MAALTNTNYTSSRYFDNPKQFSLFPEEETSLYLKDSLTATSPGYFAMLFAPPGAANKLVQRCYRVDQLPEVLAAVEKGQANYISQAVFFSSRRRVANLKSLWMAYLDIDFYHPGILYQDWGAGKSDTQKVDAFLSFCDQEFFPTPSLIIDSGRGLQCKWLFKDPIFRAILPRWTALERFLVDKFEDYGADRCAKDAARVLRLVGTTNQKSGKICKVIYQQKEGNEVLRYDFEELFQYLPLTREEWKDQHSKPVTVTPQKKTRISNEFGLESLNWAIVEDLRTLLRIRGGISEGSRMEFLFWMMNFLALSNQISTQNFFREVAFLAKEIDPAWNYRSAELHSVYEKFKETRSGKNVEFNGKLYPPLYTPKMTTLVDRLGITEEEQRQLKVIHGEEVKREFAIERKRKWRALNGALSRKEYEARADERRVRARELRAQGKSERAIAQEIGISQTQVHRYLTEKVIHVRDGN